MLCDAYGHWPVHCLALAVCTPTKAPELPRKSSPRRKAVPAPSPVPRVLTVRASCPPPRVSREEQIRVLEVQLASLREKSRSQYQSAVETGTKPSDLAGCVLNTPIESRVKESNREGLEEFLHKFADVDTSFEATEDVEDEDPLDWYLSMTSDPKSAPSVEHPKHHLRSFVGSPSEQPETFVMCVETVESSGKSSLESVCQVASEPSFVAGAEDHLALDIAIAVSTCDAFGPLEYDTFDVATPVPTSLSEAFTQPLEDSSDTLPLAPGLASSNLSLVS